MAKGWEKQRKYLPFICNRGRAHKEKKTEANNKYIARTCRPIRGEDEETCKYSFKVWWNEEHQRWCIPKEQAGCKDHNGHTHREPHECRMYAKDYGKDALELIVDGFQSAICPSMIASLIDTREGHAIDASQIRHLKKKMRDATHIRMDVIKDMANGRENPDPTYTPTAADRLLSNLESDPKYTYTVLYGQYDSDELKVYRRTKDGEGKVSTVRENPRTICQHDELDDIETYSKKVRDRLSITGSGCILLAVAWTTDEAQQKYEMFPEFSCSDVTHGTNSEKRPLLIFCGKDGNNKSFSHTWAFLPSQSRWVLDWFFSYACPVLHRASVLQRNRIHITDQDAQECGAFLDSQQLVFPNSNHRLCAFHKINRNFLEDKEDKSAVAQNNKNTSSEIELKMIVKWLNKFIRDYETEAEWQMSERLLEKYLEEDTTTHNGSLTAEMLKLTDSYFRQKFQYHRSRLYKQFFMDVPCFDNVTSSVNESSSLLTETRRWKSAWVALLLTKRDRIHWISSGSMWQQSCTNHNWWIINL